MKTFNDAALVRLLESNPEVIAPMINGKVYKLYFRRAKKGRIYRVESQIFKMGWNWGDLVNTYPADKHYHGKLCDLFSDVVMGRQRFCPLDPYLEKFMYEVFKANQVYV